MAYSAAGSGVTWKEDLIAKLQDGLDKFYRSPNHGLPDIEASEELRLPQGVEKSNISLIPNCIDHGNYLSGELCPNSPSPKRKRDKRFRVCPNNTRHPCYVGVSISKVNDIKSADAFFDLRVRLSLLFEVDLVAAGFEKWVDAARESQAGYLPLLAHQAEVLRDLGIVIPKLVFLNAVSQQHVRPVEMCLYPRPHESSFECITWSHMWDIQFRQQFDLRDFPFDTQELVMELSMLDSDVAHIMDRFHLVVYAVQYKEDLVDMPEWRVHQPKIQRRLPLHRRMNIHIPVSRQPQYYFWNIIFVVFMISTLGFTVFMESWEYVSERVSIVLTLLLTIITFQYNVSSQLPKLCYFTILDGYTFRMTVSLFLLSFGCCAAKLQQYLIHNFDSVDFLDRWDPESIDLLVSFIFAILYLFAQIQWIWLVLRKWNRLSQRDLLSNSHFGTTSRNAPSWLCFMFSHPFFIDAAGHSKSQALEFHQSTLARFSAMLPRALQFIASAKDIGYNVIEKVEKPPIVLANLTLPTPCRAKTPVCTPTTSPGSSPQSTFERDKLGTVRTSRSDVSEGRGSTSSVRCRRGTKYSNTNSARTLSRSDSFEPMIGG